MTPNDELLIGETAAFVADLRATAHGPAPEASAELRAVFASAAPITASPAATTPRRAPVSDVKRLITTIPSKVAAGVLGALLAGSLGAGAMTGTVTLTANESEVDDPTALLAEDEEKEEAEVLLVEKGVEIEEEEDEPKDPGDPTTAPIPTTVDEAAKNHQFDEACGNHGAYVSHFARTGEEPECALTTRAGGTEATGATAVEGEADVEGAEVESAGPGKSDEGKAKAAAAKAKAAERKAGGKGKAGR